MDGNAFEFTIGYYIIKNLYIICIYISPSSDVQLFFLLLNLLDLLPKSRICIDFNIDSAEVCDDIKRSLITFISFGLSRHVISTTRITKSTPITIDYAVSNLLLPP